MVEEFFDNISLDFRYIHHNKCTPVNDFARNIQHSAHKFQGMDFYIFARYKPGSWHNRYPKYIQGDILRMDYQNSLANSCTNQRFVELYKRHWYRMAKVNMDSRNILLELNFKYNR